MPHSLDHDRRISPLAGRPAPKGFLIDVAQLEREYFTRLSDMQNPGERVSFGTSGHRGSPLRSTFMEAHILAIAQAICDYREAHGIDGPLFMGKDTHALSALAQRTAIEVLAANGVETIMQRDDGVTPTPVISRAIVTYNHGRQAHLADGIAVTPSHNPPEDGGFKYNPPTGGPADTDVTRWIENRAGKNLPVTCTEVLARLRTPPAVLAEHTVSRNHLRFRINPEMTIAVGTTVMAAGDVLKGDPVEMIATHHPAHGEVDAYELVLGEALSGRSALFARQDYVEEAWRIVDPVLKAASPVHEYETGTWGPAEAEQILSPAGGWHNPVVPDEQSRPATDGLLETSVAGVL